MFKCHLSCQHLEHLTCQCRGHGASKRFPSWDIPGRVATLTQASPVYRTRLGAPRADSEATRSGLRVVGGQPSELRPLALYFGVFFSRWDHRFLTPYSTSQISCRAVLRVSGSAPTPVGCAWRWGGTQKKLKGSHSHQWVRARLQEYRHQQQLASSCPQDTSCRF